MTNNAAVLPERSRDEIIRTCRTVIGDELRSITHFTDREVDQLYLRSDLERTADLIGFAEQERTGFSAHKMYRDSQLGEYKATIRMFENGYLVRVIYDGQGIWVTTIRSSLSASLTA